MTNYTNKYSLIDINNLYDNEIINILRNEWMNPFSTQNEKIYVIGKITQSNPNYFKLTQVKLIEKLSNENYKIYVDDNNNLFADYDYLEYPINFDNNESYRYSIEKNGIYCKIKQEKKELEDLIHTYNDLLFIGEIELAHKKEREKKSFSMLVNVSNLQIAIQNKENIFNAFDIQEFFYKVKNHKENELIEIRDNKNKLEEEIFIVKTKKEEIDNLIIKNEKELENLNSVQTEIKNEIEEIKNFRTKLNKEQKDISEEIVSLQKTKKNVSENIKTLEEDYLEIEQNLILIQDNFQNKVNTLLNLGLIDKNEYDKILNIRSENKSNNYSSNFISFKKDLNNDVKKMIKHLQSYLYNKNILYKEELLEEFFSLIKTNDLIILAGDSGSGKTNLVKSFAEAIGGKSFIIPVKPNWTSSDDLLGFYNPIQKQYMSTKFLDAILEAKENPEIPYFICLDEMNLSRIEYYFADFLSILEERDNEPIISLYSQNVFKNSIQELDYFLEVIEKIKNKYELNSNFNFNELLFNKEINKELQLLIGEEDPNFLIKYHENFRDIIKGMINIPSSLEFPKNLRIIGTVNIDETTNYLSPKILDRAHILKFENILLTDINDIIDNIIINPEIEQLHLSVEDLIIRKQYPSFDKNDNFSLMMVEMTKKYFIPMGIEFGMRAVRQGLNYKKIIKEQNSDLFFFLGNFIKAKILPKMLFDGNKKINENQILIELFEEFIQEIKEMSETNKESEYYLRDVLQELDNMLVNAQNNDNLINYWAK